MKHRSLKLIKFIFVFILFWMLSGCSHLTQFIRNTNSCEVDQHFRGNSFSSIEVDLNKSHLRFFWKDQNGEYFYTFENVDEWIKRSGESIVAITNGGIYEPDYSPTGLYIENGEIKSNLNLNEGGGNFFLKPNGLFLLKKNGTAQVIESSQFNHALVSTIEYAQQSGPLLVLNNQIHPIFKKNSRHRKLRSGIGVGKNQKVYIAISNCAVTFYEFATFFRDHLKCPDALYLDGAISRLYAPLIERLDSSYGKYAVMIGVTIPKKNEEDKPINEENQ